MSKEYHKEVNKRKAKNFFTKVLKNQGRAYLISDSAVELLGDILSEELIKKLEKERKK